MKGSIGTPMVIEHAPKKKGVHCKNCKYLVCGGKNTPYTCALKNKGRHYTSVCICSKFKKKEDKAKIKKEDPYAEARKKYFQRQREFLKEERERTQAYKKYRKDKKNNQKEMIVNAKQQGQTAEIT